MERGGGGPDVEEEEDEGEKTKRERDRDREREKDKQKETRAQSLGWLTESSLMPKKQRAIEGVTAASILELRAQLYRSQEDAKRAKEDGFDADARRSSRKPSDPLTKKNAGVDQRAHRDKLQLKAETDGSAVYAALEKKSAMYEKLAKGELPDEEEREKYCVDFFRKGFLEDECDNDAIDLESNQTIPVINETHSGIDGSGRGVNEREGYKQLVREVNEETKDAREKVSVLKQRRQQQAEKNREKLRMAFVKKKLERLKATAEKEKQVEASDSLAAPIGTTEAVLESLV